MRVVALAALAAYRLLLHGPPYQGPRCTSPAPRPIALACATTVLSSLLVEAFAPIVTVQRIPARSSSPSQSTPPYHSGGGDRDVRHGAIDAAAVVSVDGDGDGDDGDGDGDDGGKREEEATDIEGMIPVSVSVGGEDSKEDVDAADADAEAAVEATADAKDEDGDATQEARPTPAPPPRSAPAPPPPPSGRPPKRRGQGGGSAAGRPHRAAAGGSGRGGHCRRAAEAGVHRRRAEGGEATGCGGGDPTGHPGAESEPGREEPAVPEGGGRGLWWQEYQRGW